MINNKKEKNASSESKKIFSFDDTIAIGIFTLYLLIDFIPTFGSYTFADAQWLYLTVLNFGVGLYIYYHKIWIDNLIFRSLFLSKIVICYIIFLVISGISIAVGLNFDEGFITFLRYLVISVSFVLLLMIFINKQHTFLTLASIVSILIIVECLKGLKVYFDNYAIMSANEIIARVKHHHDNVNIFSSNILLKIPFIFFCVVKTTKWRQFVFAFILFVCSITILFLSSRSIIAGLLLQLLVFLLGFSILKFRKKIEFKWNFPFTIFLLILFSLAIFKLKNINNERIFFKSSTEVSAQTATSNLSENQGISDNVSVGLRGHYWDAASQTIKKKPFLGCGLGNWKIESIQYELKWKPDNQNGVHAHNDFLQVAAETGILNGIVFCLIFILMIIVNLKTIFNSKNAEQSYFAIVLLASTIGLMADSFFNFPLSRPTIQILFAFLMMFSILNYYQFQNQTINYSKINISKNIVFVLLLLSFASIYPNYQIFKFYQGIKIAKQDASTLNLSYNEINTLFKDFPTLDETGTPIIDTKISYLIKEMKFKKALELIAKSTKINPYSVYSTSLKVDLFNKKNEWDSAAVYAKKVYDLQPNYQVFYERYIQGLARIKDTTNIIKAFKNLDDSNINAQHYSITFGCLLKADYGKEKSFAYIKTGLSRFPNDTKLLEISANFNKKTTTTAAILSEKELQIKASKTNNYREIEKFYIEKYATNKSDFSVVENLGICYFQQKKYNSAIEYLSKVVAANAFSNGKAEYVMAICYQNLNDKKMACQMANLALRKNFLDARIIIQNTCN